MAVDAGEVREGFGAVAVGGGGFCLTFFEKCAIIGVIRCHTVGFLVIWGGVLGVLGFLGMSEVFRVLGVSRV